MGYPVHFTAYCSNSHCHTGGVKRMLFLIKKTGRANAHTTHIELYWVHLLSAIPVILSNGQRSPKRYTLVVLMGVYNYTKFEEIRYHSLWKTANGRFSTKFHMMSVTFPWIKNNSVKLVCINYFHPRLHPHHLSSRWSQWFLRYANCQVLPFVPPVTLSKA